MLVAFSKQEARISASPTIHALHEPSYRFTVCGKLAANWSLPRDGEPTCTQCRKILRARARGDSQSKYNEGRE